VVRLRGRRGCKLWGGGGRGGERVEILGEKREAVGNAGVLYLDLWGSLIEYFLPIQRSPFVMFP